ncbi:hypothetical protein ACFV4E_22940 [Streptomyces hygroscopicus]|uniref:DUF3307 domain-containing protein n=1 Tax=Streptomyces hygroscopicus TaxID=1912 RepID=A0ABQ3UFE2_STRHY|nr:hypothetical protein [Streptomyces hygroscopicus]GHJ34327.1 hypothetical protein TPA0910_87600 [Streptomyces hygroscopicus]
MASRAARTAAVAVITDHIHTWADYWGQRDTDAQTKGLPGAEGRAACARHVANHTAHLAVALLAANRLLDLNIRPKRLATGLALAAGTHYLADRSGGHWKDTQPTTFLVRAAHKLGKQGWIQNDPTAGPHLDQAWHRAWHLVAAAIIAR